MNDLRKEQLSNWIAEKLNIVAPTLQTVSGDASFRRYFRFENRSQTPVRTSIAVDAPPDAENCKAFQQISQMLLEMKLNVPIVQEIDLSNGFMLLSDLGDQLYLDKLNDATNDPLYTLAIDAIVKMQKISKSKLKQISIYSQQQLEQELQLFNHWFIVRHLQLSVSEQEKTMIDRVFGQLVNNALNQPQVFCHSDYHSRNLMICNEKTPGIIDFQDAVKGAVTFDLVSLLKDCYISWSRNKIEQWCRYYFDKAMTENIINTTFEQFIRWFDLMGLHRHIRVLGIFTRLNYRDGKTSYLDDLALTFNYVKDVCESYPEFSEFSQFLTERIQPRLENID